jgi:hypothetical protein
VSGDRVSIKVNNDADRYFQTKKDQDKITIIAMQFNIVTDMSDLMTDTEKK